jgi:hypothetical protein
LNFHQLQATEEVCLYTSKNLIALTIPCREKKKTRGKKLNSYNKAWVMSSTAVLLQSSHLYQARDSLSMIQMAFHLVA